MGRHNGIGKYGKTNDVPGFCSRDEVSTKIYGMWQWCVKRGKDLDWQEKHPTYKGCSVSDDVLMLSNFIKWIENEPRYQEFLKTHNDVRWCIDKDSKCPGNKIYDFKYMTLMPQSENTKERLERLGSPMENEELRISKSKPVKATNVNNPNDIRFYKSMRDARKDGFNNGGVSACCNGKMKTYKGYYWEYL